MRSPGRWGFPRRVEREFWLRIQVGERTVQAAEAAGVSEVIGGRWFRQGGGMSPMNLSEPSGRYLSFIEREEIAILRAQGHGPREIGRRVGRDPSTISRELRRNAATRSTNPGERCRRRLKIRPVATGRVLVNVATPTDFVRLTGRRIGQRDIDLGAPCVGGG